MGKGGIFITIREGVWIYPSVIMNAVFSSLAPSFPALQIDIKIQLERPDPVAGSGQVLCPVYQAGHHLVTTKAVDAGSRP
jgi:hypothetical protein